MRRTTWQRPTQAHLAAVNNVCFAGNRAVSVAAFARSPPCLCPHVLTPSPPFLCPNVLPRSPPSFARTQFQQRDVETSRAQFQGRHMLGGEGAAGAHGSTSTPEASQQQAAQPQENPLPAGWGVCVLRLTPSPCVVFILTAGAGLRRDAVRTKRAAVLCEPHHAADAVG
jgi:hypothetical protein